jgi:hypothetical protein
MNLARLGLGVAKGVALGVIGMAAYETATSAHEDFRKGVSEKKHTVDTIGSCEDVTRHEVVSMDERD